MKRFITNSEIKNQLLKMNTNKITVGVYTFEGDNKNEQTIIVSDNQNNILVIEYEK